MESSDKSSIDPPVDSSSADVVVNKYDGCKPEALSGQDPSLVSESSDFVGNKYEDSKPESVSDEDPSLVPGSSDFVVNKYEDSKSEALSGQDPVFVSGSSNFVVANYAGNNAEVLSSHPIEEEQILGYLEVQNPGCESGALILEPGGLSLNGQPLILSQSNGSSEIILVVSNDQYEQALDPSFAHTSVIQVGNLSLEGGHEATIIGGGAQSLEFIKTDDLSEHEGRHVYIENINISNEHESADVVNSEQSVWSNAIQLKGENAEMLNISNPTIVSTPFVLTQDPPRHRKLMQLACIAHELRSADQKNATASEETLRNGECSKIEFEHSEMSAEYCKDSHDSLLLPENEVKTNINEVAESSLSPQSSVNANEDVSALLTSCTQSVDNAVSVIHATSDHRDDSVQNEMKRSLLSDSVNEMDLENQPGEMPTDVLYPVESRMSPVVEGDKESVKSGENNLCIETNSNDSTNLINTHMGNSTNDSTSPINLHVETNRNGSASPINLHMEINSNPTISVNPHIEINSSPTSPVNPHMKINSSPTSPVNPHMEINSSPTSPVNSQMEINSSPTSAVNPHMESITHGEAGPVDPQVEINSSPTSPANPHMESSTKEDTSLVDPHVKSNSNNAINLVNLHVQTDLTTSIPEDVNTDIPVPLNQKLNVEKGSDEMVKAFNDEDSNMSGDISSNNSGFVVVEEDSDRGIEDSNMSGTSKNISADEKPAESLVIPVAVDNISEKDNVNISDQAVNLDKNELKCVSSQRKSRVNTNVRSSLLITSESKTEEECKSSDDASRQQVPSAESENFDRNDYSVVKSSTATVDEIQNSSDTVPSADNLSQNVSFQGVLEKNVIDDSEHSHNLAKNDLECNTENLTTNPDNVSLKGNFQISSVCVPTESNTSNQKADSNAADGNAIEDMDFDTTEETLVKPPKKTYTRKKKTHSRLFEKQSIELFPEGIDFSECDKDVSDIQNSLNADKKLKTSYKSNNDGNDLGLIPVKKSRVSSIFSRKRKNVVPGIQFRSLRPRSLPSNLPVENGALNYSPGDKKDNYDSSNSENIPWGDVLMNTSFQKSENFVDMPTTSYASSSPVQSSPVSSPTKQKRKISKIKHDWERFVKSSPDKLKKQGSSRRQNLPAKVKKQALSKLKSKRFSYHLSTIAFMRRRGRPRKKLPEVDSDVKRANITYKDQSDVADKSFNIVYPLNYCCSSCSFASCRVNNLIEHLKYCTKRQPPIDYRVNDMEQRQRIRGEETENIRTPRTPQELTNYINGALSDIRDMSEAECSGLSQGQNIDSDEDVDLDFLENKNQFGYGEDDVIWARVEDRFWPALVCELTKRMVSVKLINYPTEKQGLKISAERVHTFDDAKWNKMLLTEAASLPYNEIFVKAVQTSETFVRKKWLGLNVKGKDFFSIPDEVDFVTDIESSDSNLNEEDSDFDMMDNELPMDTSPLKLPPSRAARYSKLDCEKIKKYILEGHLDDYVLDIFNRRENSKKHIKYFGESRSVSDLKGKVWFGPLEKVCEQGMLIQHFRQVFEQHIGKKHFMVSYICEVWIPEAIVKAISLIENIPLKAAESLFESDDSLESDLSPDELLKMQS